MSENIFTFNPKEPKFANSGAFYVNNAERHWPEDVAAGLAYASHDVIAWCEEQFGPPETTARHWIDRGITRTIVYFRDNVDAMAFAMRWC
jgi:hypothetical protein